MFQWISPKTWRGYGQARGLSMDKTIQNRICNGWIYDVFMPVFRRQLTDDDRRGMAMSVVDDFEKPSSFRVCRGLIPGRPARGDGF